MFKLEECATAVAVAMVGTIRGTDDATRFSQRAAAEGFENISDLIANDAVKQALALQARLAAVDPKLLSSTVTSVTHTVGDVSTTTTSCDVPGLTDFDEGNDPAKVFANTAAVPEPQTASATVSTAPEPDSIDSPLPIAPSAPVAENTISTNTTTATASGVELDSEGLPWDARIHSSSKAKIKDGTFKLKRGLETDYVAGIKAELAGVMNIPAVAPTTPPPPQPDVNPFSVSTVNKLIDAGNGATVINTPPPPAPQTGAITTMTQLVPAITAKKLDPALVTGVLQQYGVQSLPVLGARPDLIPSIAEALGL